jgi:hypothetical protein
MKSITQGVWKTWLKHGQPIYAMYNVSRIAFFGGAGGNGDYVGQVRVSVAAVDFHSRLKERNTKKALVQNPAKSYAFDSTAGRCERGQNTRAAREYQRPNIIVLSSRVSHQTCQSLTCNMASTYVCTALLCPGCSAVRQFIIRCSSSACISAYWLTPSLHWYYVCICP